MTTVLGQNVRKTQDLSHHFQSVRGVRAQILSLLPSMKEPLHIDAWLLEAISGAHDQEQGELLGQSARVEQDPLQELSVKKGCETRLQTGIVHEGRNRVYGWCGPHHRVGHEVSIDNEILSSWQETNLIFMAERAT